MARVRSPNYPALSLPDAIQSVAKVFAKEHQHRVDKEVVVTDMGYGGLNGASLGSFSALVKYGLLEQLKDGGYRVSDRAMAILHPHTPQEKAQAITAAAREPALFADMLNDFPGSIPSDDNLRSYLVRRGFSSAALSGVINAFRETMSLVGDAGGAYDSGEVVSSAAPEGRSMSAGTGATSAVLSSALAVPVQPASGPGAFQLNVMSDRLILNGTFFSRELLQDAIDKLTAMKAFLPEQSKSPDAPKGADKPSEPWSA